MDRRHPRRRPTADRPTSARAERIAARRKTGRAHRAPVAAARIAVVGLVGLAVTAGGVYAALAATAYNSSAESITSGTLKLNLGDNGNGFTQTVSNIAPNDVVQRYVDLTNAGNLDGRALTLAVADASSTKLSTDATNGLRVTVTSCTSGAWTPSTGSCGGGGSTSVLANNVALSSLTSTPVTLVSGAVPNGNALHLQVSLALPDVVETTVNGTLPTGTIQGLSASLTWTFAETQRAGTTTTS